MKTSRLDCIWPIRLSILLTLSLGGCISANTPGDLKFRSVEVVDWRDRPELPGPGASPLIGMVGDREIIAVGQSVIGGQKWHRPLLKIEFTTGANLSAFAESHSYNIGAEMAFCGHRVGSPWIGWPFVYSHGARVGLFADPAAQQDSAATDAINYYVFADVSREARPRDKPPQEQFDLRRATMDICLYLRGGNGWGGGYKSNMVTVPREAIGEALQKSASIFTKSTGTKP